MQKIFIKPLEASQGQLFFDWATESSVNEFDPEVAKFPSSFTWCAYDKLGPVAFQTVQRPYMLESLAPRPGLSKSETASALRELTQNIVTQAHLNGVGEIYYLGSDEDTDEMATNHIFERVNLPVYRVKIRELTCG